MIISTNITAINTNRLLKIAAKKSEKASGKLSGGLRVNCSADDAAGLAISEKMRIQIRGLNQAYQNTQDGISLIQTAEGGMSGISDMVKRIRELVNQAANDTNTMDDREKIQKEIDCLIEEIGATARNTEFNTMNLINGRFTGIVSGGGQQLTGEERIVQIVRDAYNSLTNAQKNSIVGANSNQTILNIKDFVDSVLPPGYRWNDGIIDPPGTILSTTFYLGSEFLSNDRYSLDKFFAEGICSTDSLKKIHITDIAMTEKIEREVRDAWLALDPSDPVRTGYAAWQPWMVEQVNSYGFFTFYVLAGQVPASSPPSKIYDYMTKVNPEPGESYNTVWNALAISGMPWKAAPPDEPKAPEDAPLWIQTGANAEQGVLLSIADMSAEALGLKDDIGTKLIDVRQEDANAISRLLTVCDTAQEYVSQERAKLGAMQNRLEHSMRSVDNSAENLSAAESRIRDADMAKEMMEYNKSNVIAQAGISLMAQANQLPQNVLLLLR